ncbi:MAG: DUF4404 family protein [Planctomycetales bacterium]|nr:DUF4404 family protein [Planctomycetales bacterium]
MDKSELLETIEKLHEHLASAQHVDEDSARQLRDVTADIHRLLDDGQESSSDSHSLATLLRSMVLSWEADHPKAAELIGRIANALSNTGI